MNKAQLRKELEEAYLKAFMDGLFSEHAFPKDVFYTRKGLDSDTSELEELEDKLYGGPLDCDETFNKAPFQKALKRWNEIKNSPLFEALK
jgi:hypothetical protein